MSITLRFTRVLLMCFGRIWGEKTECGMRGDFRIVRISILDELFRVLGCYIRDWHSTAAGR